MTRSLGFGRSFISSALTSSTQSSTEADASPKNTPPPSRWQQRKQQQLNKQAQHQHKRFAYQRLNQLINDTSRAWNSAGSQPIPGEVGASNGVLIRSGSGQKPLSVPVQKLDDDTIVVLLKDGTSHPLRQRTDGLFELAQYPVGLHGGAPRWPASVSFHIAPFLPGEAPEQRTLRTPDNGMPLSPGRDAEINGSVAIRG